MRRRSTLFLLIPFLFLCLFGSLAASNGLLQIGTGVKGRGMGGVGVALPQDAFILAANPAGVVFVSSRFDIGLDWNQLHGKARFLDLQDDLLTERRLATRRNLYWPEAGTIWRYSSTASIGLAIYAAGGFETQYRPREEGAPSLFGSTPTTSNYQVFYLSPSWGWKFDSCHSIGASINIAFGWLILRGLGEEFDSLSTSIAPGYVSSRHVDHEQGIGFTVGWMGQVTPSLRIGAAYQSRTWMNRFHRYRGFIADGGDLDLPSQWRFGISYTSSCNITLAFDAIRIQWQQSRQFRNDAQQPHLYGSSNGPGFGWMNQWVYKGGAAWNPCEWLTLRGGWNYGDQLFGTRETRINALTQAGVQHHGTLGATYRYRCNEASIDLIFTVPHRTRDLLTEGNNFSKSRIRSTEYAVGISMGRFY